MRFLTKSGLIKKQKLMNRSQNYQNKLKITKLENFKIMSFLVSFNNR